MNNLGRSNWVLMIGLLVIGMMIFVLATAPVWESGADSTNYTIAEDSVYNHNFSANVTGFTNDVTFEIAPTAEQLLRWTNATGLYEFSSGDVISMWILMINSSTGNMTINATYDNQTGFFEIPIKATNDTSAVTDYFEFIINATNDAPNFTNIDDVYNLSQDNYFLEYFNASDEESHYPLEFNITFIDNCTHASWSEFNDNENCSLFDFGFNLTSLSDTSASINFTPGYEHVGIYWANVTVSDFGDNYPCPHDYCDNSTYATNQTSETYLVKFNIESVLSINASDCNGQNLTEGDWLNCTINITTIGASDNISIASDSYFRGGSGDPHNSSWFQDSESKEAENFLVSINVSILLDKEEVGNWTINFSADDGTDETPRPVFESIYIFVNWTESNVSMGDIVDLNGASALYENYSFEINATDDDLLIRDRDVKAEELTFASNTSWVSLTNSDVANYDSEVNYELVTLYVDYDYVNSNNGTGNYSVNVSVSDTASNSDYKVFTIEILDDTAPEWNLVESPLSLNLTEDVAFSYNVSMNVSDAENDTITFYYENVSAEFCSLNSSTFNSTSGIISFTPTDCDVGYHNVTIIAGDGKLNSSYEFNFTVTNVVDSPTFESFNSSVNAVEDLETDIFLEIKDYDFLIPEGQSDFYDENLTVNLTFDNLSSVVDVVSFDFVVLNILDGVAYYQASFTPSGDNVGFYNVTVNVTDVGNASNVSYFTLNITEANDAPNLTFVENQSWTVNDVFYLDINATDEEDGDDSLGNLTYSLDFILGDDFVDGNESVFNTTSGKFNLTLNSTYAGKYDINVSVSDTTGAIDWQIFGLMIYGVPNITFPSSGYEFDWDEAIATGDLDFEVDYAVNNTDLTYRFYLDKIVYSSVTNFSYTDLIADASLRNETNYSWTDNTNFSWNWTPDYTDESYGMLKNLTLVVFNPDYPELNDSVNWKVNVTHTNQNVSFSGHIGDRSGYVGTAIFIDLSSYFSDVDYWDNRINQIVNFTITTVNGSGYVAIGSSFDGWNLSLNSNVVTSEIINVTAHEYDENNNSIGTATSIQFEAEFIEPPVVVVEVPRTSSGTRTVVKYYSLRLIMPRDIIISQKGFIDVPFSVQNNGLMDLVGISLDNFVRFNDVFSDDVTISLDNNYIEELKIGQTEDFNLRILANTQRAGKYKATVIANVTSPKFSDWGDFIIEIQKANESEAEQILVFTEKFIAENPECLELTEIFRRAEAAFAIDDYSATMSLAQEAITACEEAIKAHEQIRYKIEGAVRDNFYYILFVTLALFFMGFIFYVYKRVRFNKSEADEYV